MRLRPHIVKNSPSSSGLLLLRPKEATKDFDLKLKQKFHILLLLNSLLLHLEGLQILYF
jgi:hypothetical protein